ncbi:MAG: efflux RND transporter periplasmic adaptor subunit [Ferruginibacter sp.]
MNFKYLNNTKKNLFFLFVLALPILTSCGNKKAPDQNPNQIKSYSVLTIVPQKTTLNVDYPATIEGQQNIEIRPKVDGFIEKIFIDEGAAVKKGQMLFTISAPQYEQGVRTAQANIQIAQADVKTAEMNVEKVKPLVEKNIISKFELESAQYILQAKKAVLAHANANFANAKTNIGYTSITSPVNGIVGTIPFKVGSLVNSSTAQPLTTISNVGNVYAYFSINEKDAFSFSKDFGSGGNTGLASLPQVSLILSDGNIFPEKGKIETTSGMINSSTGSSTLRATFPNPKSIIRSGSSGSVRIPLTIDSAILVPQRSTYEIQGKTFVYVV